MSSNYNDEQDDQSQYGGYRGYTANQQQGRRPYSYTGNDAGNTDSTGTGASARDYGYGTGSYTSTSGGQQQQQQQYDSSGGTYQAPRSASRSRMTTPTDSTSFGMSARLEAALSYLIGWVTGLFFFFFERKNKYVRYHAAQSILYFGGLAIILAILKFLGGLLGGIFLIGFLLGWIFSIAVFVVGFIAFVSWLYLMFQAYRGKRVRMPYVSGLAERLSR